MPQAASEGDAKSGLPARYCRKRRRLVARMIVGVIEGTLPLRMLFFMGCTIAAPGIARKARARRRRSGHPAMHQSPGGAACAQGRENPREVTGWRSFRGSVRAKGRYCLKGTHNPVTSAA